MEIDSTRPHSARFWNYQVGGKDFYSADAEIAEKIARDWDGLADVARTSRHFLARAVRYLTAEARISQFLDIGPGLPTTDNTHEIAQRITPTSRTVYVDNDPLVLTHAHARLTSTAHGRADIIDGDVHHPEQILEAAAATLNLSQPVAVILLGILGHIDGYREAHSIARRLMRPLPSGSFLVVRDCTSTSPQMIAAAQAYQHSGAVPYHLRTHKEIASFLDGLEVLSPGVVRVPDWRPEAADPLPTAPVDAVAGVARKPEGAPA